MLKISDVLTAQLMQPKDACMLADELNAEENESGGSWMYKATHDPKEKGLSFIRIYDERHNILGEL